MTGRSDVTEDGPLQYPSESGDAACWLSQVCTECGAILEATPTMLCWRCGLTPERSPVDL